MAVLIDASILNGAKRGRLHLEPHVARHGEDEASFGVVTAGELLHGVHRAAEPDVRARRSAFVEGALERFPLLAVDLACARAHAQLWAELSRAGTPGLELEFWEHQRVRVSSNKRIRLARRRRQDEAAALAAHPRCGGGPSAQPPLEGMR